MYKKYIQSIAEVNNEIIRGISEMEPVLYQSIIENFNERVDICICVRSCLVIKWKEMFKMKAHCVYN